MAAAGGGAVEQRLATPRLALLGPVAIGQPDHLRPVTGMPGRALVALAAADRPLDVEGLADVLWGVERPASYRPALHVHLGKVRRALEQPGLGAGLTRSSEGYSLDLGCLELDAHLATSLLDRARECLSEDPVLAHQLIDAALGLWRGQAYAVDGEVIAPIEAYHMEAMRRDAVELRVELLLAAGASRVAEEAAVRAVAEEPLREHRWGQLLRARYLAGRTGAAVATYQEARSALVDALGIEPGPELRELEAAALTHDVDRLRLPLPTQGGLTSSPPSSGQFIGRDEELHRAAETITGAGRLLLLGPPGVGKSRFALELAVRLGVEHAWVDLASGVSPTAVLDWARRHPEGLVVLDHAEEDVEAVRSLVVELARSMPRGRTLIASRRPVGVEGAVEVLRPLRTPRPDADDDDIERAPAVVALRAALRDLAPTATPSSAEAAALVRHAGGLPLAIRLLAASARTLQVASILDLPASGADDEIDRATRSVLSALDDRTRDTFLALAYLRDEFDLEVVAQVAGLTRDQASATILTLADHGLVLAQPAASDGFTIPPPLRAVGQRLIAPTDRSAVADRFIEMCLLRSRQLEQHSSGVEIDDLAIRLRPELSRFRQALDDLAARRDPERALTLACRAELPLYSLGWWRERTELFEAALAIPGPPTAMRGWAHALHARAGPLHLTDLDEAERAEDIAIALDRPTLLAFARVLRAQFLMSTGRYDEAAELFRATIGVFEAEGRGLLACDATKFLGLCLVQSGEGEEGIRLQREALARLRRDHPSPFYVGHSLGFLGHSHRFLGDDAAAFAAWTEARGNTERIGNRATAAHIAIGLAELAVERDAPEEALALTSEALDTLATGQLWTYEPWAWTVALRAHLGMDDLPAAAACARRALDGLDRVPPGESVRLGIELAALAVAAKDDVSAARVLGMVAATPDLRELPYPSPAEAERRDALHQVVEARLGNDATSHLRAGARCSPAEAVGRLLAELP